MSPFRLTNLNINMRRSQLGARVSQYRTSLKRVAFNLVTHGYGLEMDESTQARQVRDLIQNDRFIFESTDSVRSSSSSLTVLTLFFRVLTPKSHFAMQLSSTQSVMLFSSVSGVKALLTGIVIFSPQLILARLRASRSFHQPWWLWPL